MIDQTHDDQRVDDPGDVVTEEVGELGGEDEDRQSVDEAGHDAAGMNRISFATPSSAKDDLEEPAEDDGGDEVVQPVLVGDRGDDQGDRAGSGGDHRGATTDERDSDGHDERGEQPDLRGRTPARMEKEIASGISARATTRPARISVLS